MQLVLRTVGYYLPIYSLVNLKPNLDLVFCGSGESVTFWLLGPKQASKDGTKVCCAQQSDNRVAVWVWRLDKARGLQEGGLVNFYMKWS